MFEPLSTPVRQVQHSAPKALQSHEVREIHLEQGSLEPHTDRALRFNRRSCPRLIALLECRQVTFGIEPMLPLLIKDNAETVNEREAPNLGPSRLGASELGSELLIGERRDDVAYHLLTVSSDLEHFVERRL